MYCIENSFQISLRPKSETMVLFLFFQKDAILIPAPNLEEILEQLQRVSVKNRFMVSFGDWFSTNNRTKFFFKARLHHLEGFLNSSLLLTFSLFPLFNETFLFMWLRKHIWYKVINACFTFLHLINISTERCYLLLVHAVFVCVLVIIRKRREAKRERCEWLYLQGTY